MRACVMRREQALLLSGVDVENIVDSLKPADDAHRVLQLFVRQAIHAMKDSVYSANEA
jgi:hypothetical protein